MWCIWCITPLSDYVRPWSPCLLIMSIVVFVFMPTTTESFSRKSWKLVMKRQVVTCKNTYLMNDSAKAFLKFESKRVGRCRHKMKMNVPVDKTWRPRPNVTTERCNTPCETHHLHLRQTMVNPRTERVDGARDTDGLRERRWSHNPVSTVSLGYKLVATRYGHHDNFGCSP